MPIEFQRSIVFLFIGVLTTVTTLHTVFVVALHATSEIDFYVWDSAAAQQLVVALPLLLLLLLLGSIWVFKYRALDWSSGRPQLAATLLVFASPLALEGSVSGRSSNTGAIMWAGAAVLIQCCTTPVQLWRWWAWMAGYGMGATVMLGQLAVSPLSVL